MSKVERELIEFVRGGCHVNLYSPRGTGKTTLVKKICETYRGIFLDFQLINCERDFREYLAQSLEINPDFRWFQLSKLVKNKKLLCLDEFEKILSFDRQERYGLYGVLRGLAQAGTFQLIVISQKPLYELVPEEEFLTSPLYNIFIYLDLTKTCETPSSFNLRST